MTPEQAPEYHQHTFVEAIFVAGNRGPCGGVNMALEAAYQVLDIRDRVAGYRVEAENIGDIEPRFRIYSLWDIVHNKPVMAELAKRGLISVNSRLDLIPRGSAAFKPAHGGPSWMDQYASEMGWHMIDVTCQLVTRVQNFSKRAESEGKHVIYIGVTGHPETIGVMGQLNPDNITLVERPEDVSSLILPGGKQKIVFSQTTLSPREVLKVEEVLLSKYPEVEIPNRLDICYATYNRQEAVNKLIEEDHINMLIVVGSQHSHNSKELRDLGLLSGIPSYLVDYPHELRVEWFAPWIKKVGATSGASVRDSFLSPVIDHILRMSPKVSEPIYEDQVIPEADLTFKLPQTQIDELKEYWALKDVSSSFNC